MNLNYIVKTVYRKNIRKLRLDFRRQEKITQGWISMMMKVKNIQKRLFL